MSKGILSILILLIACSAFAGIITGSLDIPGTPTDTAWVFAFHDFTTLLDTAFFYTTALPPDYGYIFDDPGLINAYDWNVMALIPSAMPPVSGDPAGQYPANPFQISGGVISGIDVTLSAIGSLTGHITYSGSADSLKLNIYSYYPMLFGGTPGYDGTWSVSDTSFTIDSIPSGAKTLLAWSDINGSGACDILDEPHAWHTNDIEGVIIIGGGVATVVDFDLVSGDISENDMRPREFGINVFPNPFNATASILVAGCGEPITIEVLDLNGRLVERLWDNFVLDGFTVLRYTPSPEVPGGIYLVRAVNNNLEKSKKIIYLR